MLCAGSVRAKNVKNVILWNLLDSCGGGLAFWCCGYAFAYGGDEEGGPKTFIGNTGFFLRNDDIQYESWFFQFAFACALSSIVAGTIAERTKMEAYLLYSVFLVGFVYPVVRRFLSLNFFVNSPCRITSFSHRFPILKQRFRLHTHFCRTKGSFPTLLLIPSLALEPLILPDLVLST